MTVPNSKTETVPIFNKINKRIDCQNLSKVQAIRSAYLVETSVFPESNYRDLFENFTLTLENDITDENALVDAIFSQNMALQNTGKSRFRQLGGFGKNHR